MLEYLGRINEQHRKYVHVDIFNNNNQRRGHELGGVGDTGGGGCLVQGVM